MFPYLMKMTVVSEHPVVNHPALGVDQVEHLVGVHGGGGREHHYLE